jgi:tetratricopeptide (TPR) repeat protein
VKAGAVALTASLWLAAGGSAASAGSASEHAIAEGRYHLRKANDLAGDDRCQAAIHEYTLAFKKLGDPVVLFNRAECYRRIGEDERAVTDYRAFLEAVPAAPNRAQIEAKIATLSATPTGAPDVNPSPVAGAVPARPNGRGPERPTAPPPARSSATPSPYLSAERPPLIDDSPPAAPAAPAAPVPAVTLVQAAPVVAAPPEGEGHHGTPWIWLAVGAAVAGGAVGAYFALRTPATVPPSTELGNYKF